jgi:hypothetical protein
MRSIRFAGALVTIILMGLSLASTPIRASGARAAARNSAQHENKDEQEEAKNFSGVIVSLNGALFVLRDDDNGTWYHLDDQKAAGKYQGKKVSITGTLDARSDMIHIRTIQEAKA